MRKYFYFIVATNFGENQVNTWNEALKMFGAEDSATIYGKRVVDDEIVVIKSK